MTQRFRSAGRTAANFAWQNRRRIARAALTYIVSKPVISTGNLTAGTYHVTDLTALLETDLQRQLLSPTYVRVRGHLWIQNLDTDAVPTGNWGWGLFVGPENMDADDFPDFLTSPSRFMGYDVRAVGMYGRATSGLYTNQGDSGTAIYPDTGLMFVRNGIKRRPKPGEHLFLLIKSSLATSQVLGEIGVLTAVR